jgi:hypothetical protein
MLRFDAEAFLRAYDTIVSLRLLVNSKEFPPDAKISFSDVGNPGQPSLGERVSILAQQLDHMGLSFTSVSVRHLIELLKNEPVLVQYVRDRVTDIGGRISDELKTKTFFCLGEHGELLDSAIDRFGSDVGQKYPSAGFDIEEAGKCLALQRPTATVFHTMRVLEIGLHSVSKCLSIPDPVTGAGRNWGAMLQKIKNEMERRSSPRTPGWTNPTDKDFFAEIYASLDAVRNVWRNATMHVEKKYTVEEAEHIWYSVSGFMRKLSSRCDEQGQPSA